MNYTFRKATAILFSRIVLTQLDNEQRGAFRKAEKLTKQNMCLLNYLAVHECFKLQLGSNKVFLKIKSLKKKKLKK